MFPRRLTNFIDLRFIEVCNVFLGCRDLRFILICFKSNGGQSAGILNMCEPPGVVLMYKTTKRLKQYSCPFDGSGWTSQQVQTMCQMRT